MGIYVIKDGTVQSTYDETGALFPDQLPRIWLILVGQRPKDRRVAAHGRRPVTAMRLVVIVVVRRVPAAANACDRQRSVGWFGSPLPIVGDVDDPLVEFLDGEITRLQGCTKVIPKEATLTSDGCDRQRHESTVTAGEAGPRPDPPIKWSVVTSVYGSVTGGGSACMTSRHIASDRAR